MLNALTRVPLFWLLFSWNIGVVVLAGVIIYKLLFWMLGFWKCKTCKKSHWANTLSWNHESSRGFVSGPFCENCYIDYLDSRTIKPPPPGWRPSKPRSGQ